jgi:hypothetical protein
MLGLDREVLNLLGLGLHTDCSTMVVDGSEAILTIGNLCSGARADLDALCSASECCPPIGRTSNNAVIWDYAAFEQLNPGAVL